MCRLNRDAKACALLQDMFGVASKVRSCSPNKVFLASCFCTFFLSLGEDRVLGFWFWVFEIT